MTRIRWIPQLGHLKRNGIIFILKALNLDIASTETGRDSEFKPYVKDHLLAPRLKENIGLPLDGYVFRA